jgi:hypothetical protein
VVEVRLREAYGSCLRESHSIRCHREERSDEAIFVFQWMEIASLRSQ